MFRLNLTGSRGYNDTKAVKIMVPLEYLNNSRRTVEMLLIKTSIIWSRYACCVISNAAANQETTFPITQTNLHVPVVTLSADDNVKLLQQLKSVFKLE